MKAGVSGKPIPAQLPFAEDATKACATCDFPPCLLYAIKQNETDDSSDPWIMQDGAIGDFMPDGSNAGHGQMQLTSSYCWDWYVPYSNFLYALEVFLVPAWQFWVANTSLEGEQLVKAISASYNQGVEGAWDAHCAGDVDFGDTDDYGARCVDNYLMLIA